MPSNIGTDCRIKIIINPSARSGRGQARLRALLAADRRLSALPCVESRSPEHFRELVQAAQDRAAGLAALAIAGGDGTVTLALDALSQPGVSQRVPLGLLPTGSGNDFVNDLQGSRELTCALRILRQGPSAWQARWVDVGQAQPVLGRAQSFCCVASVGLDELALRRIHGSRFRRSQALNLAAALSGLWQYRPRRVAITWQGGSFDGEIMFAAITNTRSYGGGFRVSPDARLDDGKLDVCIVPAMAKTRLLWNFPRILRGTHGALPGIILSQSPWVTLRSADRDGAELPLCIDGELPQHSTPVRLHCQPRRLLVLRPSSAAIAPAAPTDDKEAA